MKGHNGYIAVTDVYIDDVIGYGVLRKDHDYLKIKEDSLVFWPATSEVVKVRVDNVDYVLVKEGDIVASYLVEEENS